MFNRNELIALADKEQQKAPAPGSESRPLTNNVRKIKLSGAVKGVLRQGAEPRLEVFANNADDLSKITTTIVGDCLTIDNEPTVIFGGRHNGVTVTTGDGNVVAQGFETDPGFRAVVTLPNLSSVRVSVAGQIKSTTTESAVARVPGVAPSEQDGHMAHTIWIAPGEFGKRKTEEEFIRDELVDVPPFPCDFQVGDIVTFTKEYRGVFNEYCGVFPGMQIIGFSKEEDAFHGRFIHLAEDAFWFPHKPEDLTLEHQTKSERPDETNDETMHK